MNPAIIITNVILLFIILKRVLTYLHPLQQDHYHPGRFCLWLFSKRAFDHYMTMTLLCASALNALGLIQAWQPIFFGLVQFTTWIVLLTLALREPSPIHQAKKKLVMTARAKRIYWATIVLCTPLLCLNQNDLTMILSIQALPFILIIGWLVTAPVEYFIQRNLLNKAKHRLQTINPIIIGITGSYGKTSIKHILHHILSKHKPCIMTPGSVNTPMGICRIINQQLAESHECFIVEMGAYKRGSINHLCNLTPPHLGIITSIGPCHLERFGSIENIAIAKAELLDAICQQQNPLGFTFPDQLKSYPNFAKHADHESYIKPITLKKVTQNHDGIAVECTHNDKTYTLKAPIFGLHQGDNIVLAATIASQLGMPMEIIQSALRSLPQVKARLEVKQDKHNVTWINDGFNANPSGFKQGIHLLTQFGANKKGRTIIVTPGVTELGSTHDQVHETLAKYVIEKTDIIIAIASERIQSFISTCNQYKTPSQVVMQVATFKEANAWLKEHLQPNDTILLANDLPDVLESKINI